MKIRRKLRVCFALVMIFSLVLPAAACAPKQQAIVRVDQYDEAIQAARSWRGPVHPVAARAYNQGLEHYRAQRWSQAANLLAQAVEVGVANFPMRSDAMIYQADALQKAGKNLDAAAVARQCIAEYPGRWEARVILAEYWIWRENYANAQEQLAAAARIAPREPRILHALARVQLRQGMLIDAVETARAARAAQPDDSKAGELVAGIYLAHARHLESMADIDGALQHLFQAAAESPADGRPQIVIGRLLLVRGFPQAARQFTAAGRAKLPADAPLAAELFPSEEGEAGGDIYEFLRMGDFYLGRDQLDAAARHYRQGLAAEPNHPDVWFKLGMAQHQAGETLAARECLHALWLLDPDSEPTAELEKALELPPDPSQSDSPGFVVDSRVSGRREIGASPPDANPSFAPGARVYCAVTLGKPAGMQRVRWEVKGPTGNIVAAQEWPMTFFGRTAPLVLTGAWFTPGKYEVVWSTDGAVRAKDTFEIK